jgi:hypothetical protein
MTHRFIESRVALAVGPPVWRVPLLHHRHSMGKGVLTKVDPRVHLS